MIGLGLALQSGRAGVAVVPASPVNTGLPFITGTAQVGQVLTANPGTWTNSPSGFAYVWRRAGVAISGAAASTYTVVPADEGTVLTVTVTATNAGGSAAATSNGTAAVIPASPANTGLPFITGTAQVGQVLTANPGTWTNSPSGFAYVWRRAGVAISGATSGTYTVVLADEGTVLTVTVTATNAGGSAAATSNGTAAVIAAPVVPANTVLPAITGTTIEGQTLTSSTGTWTGTATITYGYQWRRGGVAISGALSSTYALIAADVGTRITVTVTATNAAGSVTATSAAISAILSVTPSARWHPQFSAVTQAGGRVVSAADLMGLAGLTDNGAGSGPQALTDARGRAFWRFDGAQFLNIATSLVFDNRNMTVFAVQRGNPLVSIGNVAAGTQLSGNLALDSAILSGSANFLRVFNRAGSGDAANAPWMLPGAQLQVLGGVSRTTAAGGSRLAINERFASVAQNSIARSGIAGGEIGRNSMSVGVFGRFDLYELVMFTGLTNAQFDATAAALTAHYAIPAITSQLVLEGDSITAGTGLVAGHLTGQRVLTDPDAGLIPENWRVVNLAQSGATVVTMTTRRDAVDGWASMTIPGGQNVMAFEIGRNDLGTAAALYTSVVAYLNTTTTGVLQRGWTVRALANIASAPALQAEIVPHRAALRNPQFLTDTLTATGQTYAGKLSVVDTDLITDGGQTIFATSADAADPVYYAGDSTHPTVLGARLRVTGGDVPARGVASGLTG